MRISYKTFTVLYILVLLIGNNTNAQHRRTVKAVPQPLPQRIDYKVQLPANIKKIIDSNFSSWEFKSDLVEYQYRSSPFRECHINEDTIADYAFHILSRLKGDTIECFIVIVSDEESYTLFTLQSFARSNIWFGAYYLEIFKSGTAFENAPFEEEGDKRTSFSTDCVSVSMIDKNACYVYLFQQERFKVFSPCD
jgi:hypothetical protein